MIRTMILTAALLSAADYSAQSKPGAPTAREHRNENPQAPRTADERADRETERMAKELALTDEQKEQWRAAAVDRQQAGEPLREKMRGSTTPEERREIREKLHANRKAFDKRVEEFLTAEQKRRLEEQREAGRGRMKEKRRGGRH